MKQNGWLFFFSCLLFLNMDVRALDIDAVLDWSDQRQLGTTVTGKVALVNVKEGMRVKKGDVLIALDHRYFKVKKREALANLRHAKLVMQEAQDEKQRAIELFERTVLSEYELQQAEIDFAKQQAAYANAQAKYQFIHLEDEYSRIKAPFDAVILSVKTAPEEVIVNRNEAMALVGVARSDEMLARGWLPIEPLSQLSIGQKVEVAFRGEWKVGIVKSLGLVPKNDSNTMKLYAVTVSFVVDSVEPRSGEHSAIRLPD